MANIETKNNQVWTFHKIQQRANEINFEGNAVTENLFVLGNGESRKDIDVELLKTKGKVYGCNAIYREHVVDGLIAVDPMLEHEIYRSGYCDNNKVYFRDWENLPNETYDMMKEAQRNYKGSYISGSIGGVKVSNPSSVAYYGKKVMP